MVAAKLATMKMGDNQHVEGPSIGGPSSPSVKDRKQAAKDLNVGISTLDRARKIQRLGSPELVAAVESGEATVGAAYTVSRLKRESPADPPARAWGNLDTIVSKPASEKPSSPARDEA